MSNGIDRGARIAAGDRLIRLSGVLKRVPIGRSTIYERMKNGTFPLSEDCGGGVVAWYESDVNDWLSRPASWRADELPKAA